MQSRLSLMLCWVVCTHLFTYAQTPDHTLARRWNEILLEAIRNDFARPTVHARNLFHSSVIMYDSWAFFDDEARTYFLGQNVHGFATDYPAFDTPIFKEGAINEVMSMALFRLLEHRFRFSPGYPDLFDAMFELAREYGFPMQYTGTDYTDGTYASLGNYLGTMMVEYGMQDGANEEINYGNYYYQTINEGLNPEQPGNPALNDPNRWQPLILDLFIDQSGNPISGATTFLSPEWGNVTPFALSLDDQVSKFRGVDEYKIYHDPGNPPYFGSEQEDLYKWGFELVSIWGSHLDPSDGVLWDISPGSIGNIPELPSTFEEMSDFYVFLEGGDPSLGWDLNPATGEPYEPQLVPRADYARVLAEFWADGPDSETPPGHWFTILNYVNDHPLFEKRFKGEGNILNELEWDVKAYFVLGAAMHDAAIAAWGIKGWYDYIRPVSAIRYLAQLGQSSDDSMLSYHEGGIRLYEGLIELVTADDPLAGEDGEHVGKVKLYSWKGPDYIDDEQTDIAGVGWILAENWWPYQRPTFVTPPFAGYISGHSTFSRAAAEVMTLLTGDEFFPGGMGEFIARKNEFLVFEEGPSQDITLQWATYRDASDQTSLSRIWGGIHPPADDIPGRLIGLEVGIDAFEKAERIFENQVVTAIDPNKDIFSVYPNPIASGDQIAFKVGLNFRRIKAELINTQGQILHTQVFPSGDEVDEFRLSHDPISEGLYFLKISTDDRVWVRRVMVVGRE